MNAPTITRPALRYHGGKFRLAPWVLQFFPPHHRSSSAAPRRGVGCNALLDVHPWS